MTDSKIISFHTPKAIVLLKLTIKYLQFGVALGPFCLAEVEVEVEFCRSEVNDYNMIFHHAISTSYKELLDFLQFPPLYTNPEDSMHIKIEDYIWSEKSYSLLNLVTSIQEITTIWNMEAASVYKDMTPLHINLMFMIKLPNCINENIRGEQ